MNAEPLSKAIYDKAKSLGITEIILNWSGGNDEGYLDVETAPKWDANFGEEIKEWAWDTYHYSGAGDGNSYGDNINYNLETGKVTTEEWYHVVQNDDAQVSELEISEDE